MSPYDHESLRTWVPKTMSPYDHESLRPWVHTIMTHESIRPWVPTVTSPYTTMSLYAHESLCSLVTIRPLSPYDHESLRPWVWVRIYHPVFMLIDPFSIRKLHILHCRKHDPTLGRDAQPQMHRYLAKKLRYFDWCSLIKEDDFQALLLSNQISLIHGSRIK